MKRWEIIQYLIDVNNYKSYLELGTDSGECFEKIDISKKVCVDIVRKYKGTNYHMSCEQFFSQNKDTFDIIFIDANHEDKYCWFDIQQSLNILNWNGVIVCHDCNPQKEEYTKYNKGFYNGTVYKSIIRLRETIPYVKVCTVDADYGVGILIKTCVPQPTPQFNISTFSEFLQNNVEILNLVSVAEFKRKFTTPVNEPILLPKKKKWWKIW